MFAIGRKFDHDPVERALGQRPVPGVIVGQAHELIDVIPIALVAKETIERGLALVVELIGQHSFRDFVAVAKWAPPVVGSDHTWLHRSRLTMRLTCCLLTGKSWAIEP